MPKLLFVIMFFFSVSNGFALDINIKLRKTDFDQLKQQLIPQFEQKIAYLQSMKNCLGTEKDTKACIDELPITDIPLKKRIQKALSDRQITDEQIVDVLTELIGEANVVRACLINSESVNEVKDCALQ